MCVSLFRFLFDLNSTEYRSYRNQVEVARQEQANGLEDAVAGTSKSTGVKGDYGQFVTLHRGACYRDEDDDTEDSDTEYRRVAKERNLKNMKNRLVCHYEDSDSSSSDQQEQPKYEGSRFNQENFPSRSSAASQETIAISDSGPSGSQVAKKKRKSRWDEETSAAAVVVDQPPVAKKSKLDRSNPEVIRLAVDSFGSVDLDEEQWAKVEQQFQIKQVYNEMLAKRAERERLAQHGRHKFEYDSDEDLEGGTWEHKMRKAEMEATQSRETAPPTNGRHHIGDYLPPDELKRFMEKKKRKEGGGGDEVPPTDYQDKKLTEDNKGFQMLQKLGWKDGEGLGASSSGIVNPINK